MWPFSRKKKPEKPTPRGSASIKMGGSAPATPSPSPDLLDPTNPVGLTSPISPLNPISPVWHPEVYSSPPPPPSYDPGPSSYDSGSSYSSGAGDFSSGSSGDAGGW